MAGKRKESDLDDMAAQIEEGMGEEKRGVVELVSTGSDIFDLVAGGGVPWGKIINIIGDNSTAKTLFCCEIISSAKKQLGDNLVFRYNDSEAGFSFDTLGMYGFSIVDENSPCSETIEEFSIDVEKALDKIKPEQRLIYVVDSLDALTSVEEMEQYDDKMDAVEKGKKLPGSYGMAKAKFTNEFFRIMTRKIKEKNGLLIIVSQCRENIGISFGAKYKRNGSKALDFYCAQIFWTALAEKYGRDGKVSGVCIKIRNSKNKIGVPYKEGFIDVLFNHGLDNITSNLKFLYNLKTPEGKDKEKIEKEKFDWNGIDYGYRELIKYVEDNDLEVELSRKVKKKWRENEKKYDLSLDRKKKY